MTTQRLQRFTLLGQFAFTFFGGEQALHTGVSRSVHAQIMPGREVSGSSL